MHSIYIFVPYSLHSHLPLSQSGVEPLDFVQSWMHGTVQSLHSV